MSNKINGGLGDKIKSRAKQQEIQLKQYIDNIDINSYFEDSPTIKEETYNKLKKLINNFPNEDLIYKILKDTDKKYRKQINYLFEEFAYIIGAEKIQEFIIYFINEMKDDLNNYSIDKITSRSIWSNLDDELILNELKKYKDSEVVDRIYNKNFRYYKKEEFKLMNESSESREEQFKIFAKKVTEKMGIPEPQYLDSGFFGSAFIIDNDRILKITTDKSEALNANKIKNKTTHFIAKVFDVKGFKFNDKEYFFIILEKVKTDFEFLHGIIENLISWFEENHDEDFVTYISEGEFKDLKQLEIELYNDNKQLYNFFTNFVELKKELMKYNITSADFINASNLGFRGKRVVAFDLGISDDEGDIENFDLFEGLNLKSRANQQEEQRNDYIRKEGINDYTITFLYGENHNDLPKDIQSMIFSFYENLMENLMRSNDNHWKRRVLNNDINRDIFKLLPDEFKSDIIDLRIDTDMGLDKNHFDSASNEQRDKYLNKAKEYRQVPFYSWEEKYLNGINENLNLKSRAKDQEKQRDEYVKNILKKDLIDLKPNDLDFLNNRKYRTLFNNKVKEYFYNIGFLFDDIDLTEDGNFPGLILKNGNEKYNNNLMIFLVNNGNIKVYKSDNILKFYDGKYFIRYVTNMLKNLDESLNLKSRANQQEKQKQEYINQILNGNSLEELTPEQRIKLLQIDWTVLKPLFVKIKEIYSERNKVYGSVDTVFDNKIYCHIGQNVTITLSPTNGLFTVSWGLKKSDFKSFKGVLKKLEEIKSEYPFLIENFNLKSRAKDQEKQAIEYYTNKIKKGGVIDYNISNILPYEIKILNIENIIEKIHSLSVKEFDFAPDYLKIKYIKKRLNLGYDLHNNEEKYYKENIHLF